MSEHDLPASVTLRASPSLTGIVDRPLQEADGVLDRALLVARVGVAVAALEAVVAPELGEQRRLGDGAADHPAGLGGVVEHHGPGRAAPAPEYRGEARAQALGALRAKGVALAVVGVRQRRRQHLEGEVLAAHDRAEVAEVHLAGARLPVELQEALAAARRPGGFHSRTKRRTVG